jgi:transcriptional regulator GlxA family with amidase domain
MYQPRLAKIRPDFDPDYFEEPVDNPLPLPVENYKIERKEPVSNRSQRRLKRYQEIKQLMHDNISNSDFSLHKVAEEIGISDRQIQRIFTGQESLGFRQELTRMRLSRACWLLKNTDHSISEISDQVGYKQSMHFAKAFRRQSGLSPRQWRKQHQAKNTTISH